MIFIRTNEFYDLDLAASSRAKKSILQTSAIAAFVMLPLLAGMLASRVNAQSTITPGPKFDVASVKENKSDNTQNVRMSMGIGQPGGRMLASNVTLRVLLTTAYQLPPSQMLGAPDWTDSEHFDIEANAAGNPDIEQKRLMLQALLADRFKMVAHHETRQLPLYALVMAKPGKPGAGLHADDQVCPDPNATAPPPNSNGALRPPPCGGLSVEATPGGLKYTAQKMTMARFVTFLGGPGPNQSVDRPVIDRTGLTGNFDFTLEFAPPAGLRGPQGTGINASDSAGLPLLPTALQEQLGLKLEPQTGPVDVLVIDHVEQPSEN